MGSFYSTCSLTGLTLSYNVKMVAILLVPSAYRASTLEDALSEWQLSKDIAESLSDSTFNTPKPTKESFNPKVEYDSSIQEFSKGLQVSNDESLAHFTPFGFPIYGTYDDYGRITNIEENSHTKILEKFFKISIGDILNAAESESADIPENADHIEILNLLKITHIHRDVYEYLAKAGNVYVKESWNSEMHEEYLSNCLLLVEEYKQTCQKLEKIYKQSTKTEDQKLDLIRCKWNINHIVLKASRNLIPSLCKHNMFELLDLDTSYQKSLEDLYYFIASLNVLRKLLIPSQYGSQDTNYIFASEFYEKVSQIAKNEYKK